ncbi:magnesium chelatase subunit D [Jiella avicenniae]|uniref:Magnesium chelatase subunit D n=1 Tax=Jiella avicenniae TaxID=2907202 RepID=A0A9X1P0B7_9HYPH|nr:magnesium chelatase subunit D [Jiella avicenniae]MCE7027454.1 magnesium chelatase subunit D [Jiella avicenniae]
MTAGRLAAANDAARPAWTETPGKAAALWHEAVRAIGVFAVDPGIGLRLAARAGPVRAATLETLRSLLPRDAPFRRMPAGIAEAALLGGLDLAASLESGQPVLERGLLAASDGGVLVAAMAERMTEEAAGLLALALDRGHVSVERDGVSRQLPTRIGIVALDEGMEPDEAPPASLCERLGLWLSLDGADPRGAPDHGLDADRIASARRHLPSVEPDEAAIETICQAAMAFGIVSLRVPHLAVRAARASAALTGRSHPSPEDVETAIRLVLLPRAVTMPQMPNADEGRDDEPANSSPDEEPAAEPPPPEPETETPRENDRNAEPPQDMTIDAAATGLPADLLASLATMTRPPLARSGAGRSGGFAKRARRGRVVGTRQGDPCRDRLDLLATLRTAAPWQAIRRAERAPGVVPRFFEMRISDIRVRRHRGKAETATIFCVDASGSAALARLAEAKGAVERILAECYVRRDRVALVAFRGTRADVLLAETKSLTRAKRSLAALPAGGGTPLASGILAALDLARSSAREGRTPLLALLTDGRANIGRNGAAGRPQAGADAKEAAKAVRAGGIAALVIDLSQRPSAEARQIAADMGATYLALPRADSRALSDAVAAAPRGGDAPRTSRP